MKHAVNIMQKFKACVHYVSSSTIANNKEYIKESPSRALTVIAIPFGKALTVYIKRKAKSSYYKVNF